MTSFFEYVQFQAKSNPAAPAIIHAKGVVEYRQLVRNSLAAANYLRANGLKPGDTIALQLVYPPFHCSAILGAMLAGIASFSLPTGRDVPSGLQADALLSDGKSTAASGLRLIPVTPGWLESGHAEDEGPPLAGQADDRIARIIYTSGTTGTPKAVPFTEEQLIRRVWTQIVGLRPYAGPSRSFSMMGLISGAGFTNMMLTFMTGGTLFIGWNSAQAVSYLSLYGIDRILVSTAQLMKLAAAARAKHINFPTLKSVVVGGSHVSPQFAQRMQSEICRNLICLYGSTEVGVVATAPADVIIQNKLAAGYVVPGVRVEASDEKGNTLGPGEEGRIRIHVSGAPSRYVNDEEASKAAFRDGWFYSGDVGNISQNGLLFLSGRQTERINASGIKVAPAIIEDAIHAWPGIVDVAAFEHLNELGMGEIAAAIVADGDIDQAGLRNFCNQRLRECTPKRILLVKVIPRNETGKIDRERLQRMAMTLFRAKDRATGEKPIVQG